MKPRIVGTSFNRVGGTSRVTGAQKYVADLILPNMLHAKLVHLDCAHGRIVSIDRTRALKVPGVRGILTGDDLPKPVPRFGPTYKDRPLLAVEKIRFHGEPVAIVAAETEHAASEAAAAVSVRVEALPPILTVSQALDPSADPVQDPSVRPEGPFRKTNILGQWNYNWGDVDGCRADLIVEREYTFPMVQQFAIEPFAFLAEPTADGINVFAASQNPYQLRRMVGEVLGMPLSSVRVIAPDPGGAFGGKQHPKYEPLLAYFALKLGRPLRLELTLEETFQAVRRSSAEAAVRSGFRRDGTLVFQDIEVNYLIGAYADIAARIVSKAAYVAAGPYRVPNTRIAARAVFSHTVPCTAFRGFGVPQINWAVESQIDEAAQRLGMDRVEIRLKNLPRRGEEIVPRSLPADGRWTECLEKAAEALGWGTHLEEGCGRGIAMGMKMGATTAASYAIVRLHMDGSATVAAGTSDMGQGARTVLTQIASEELGLAAEKIALVMGDTALVPFDLQTSASRSTVFMGNAVAEACREIKTKLRELAHEQFGIPLEAVTVSPGTVHLPNRNLAFPEMMIQRYGGVAGEVIGVGSARSEAVKGHPMNGRAAYYELVCIGSEVWVDRETGEMEIRKMVVSGDVGRAINPQHVSMQDEGAAVMGIGHSLMEHYILDESGCIRNLGALDYLIPTIKDIPSVLKSIHIENGDGPGYGGAKGCAEGGILCTASSIGAAVEEAIGKRIRDLPLTPERVWHAIHGA